VQDLVASLNPFRGCCVPTQTQCAIPSGSVMSAIER